MHAVSNLLLFYYFRPQSPAKAPVSRIPIRTANAEKRAREMGLLQEMDVDETKLTPTELRALR